MFLAPGRTTVNRSRSLTRAPRERHASPALAAPGRRGPWTQGPGLCSTRSAQGTPPSACVLAGAQDTQASPAQRPPPPPENQTPNPPAHFVSETRPRHPSFVTRFSPGFLPWQIAHGNPGSPWTLSAFRPVNSMSEELSLRFHCHLPRPL